MSHPTSSQQFSSSPTYNSNLEHLSHLDLALPPPAYSPSSSSSSSSPSKLNNNCLSPTSFELVWGRQRREPYQLHKDNIWGSSVSIKSNYGKINFGKSSQDSVQSNDTNNIRKERIVKENIRRTKENVWFSGWRRSSHEGISSSRTEMKSPWA